MEPITADQVRIAIRPGISVPAVNAAFNSLNHSICFKLQLENYTSFDLIAYDNYVHKGHVSILPTNVKPGEMEAMAGHKNDWFSGIQGIATWEIGGTGKIISVMYSLPYTYEFSDHTNWLAVGIHNKVEVLSCGLVSAKDWFNRMYGAPVFNGRRKNFAEDARPVMYTDYLNRFNIIGLMGNEHQCAIKILLTASKIEERAVDNKRY